MWPRKQLDIGWGDFLFGLVQFLTPSKAPSNREILGDAWIPHQEAIISLSVRTSWDLMLEALELPTGSEVILTAVTIPDMVRIIEHHGLVPVPVDVDAERLEPAIEEIERAITPRTRAILVAHLFGTRVDMGPIVEVARKHGMLVIEDCAQAFVGREYAGHPQTDCSLFSFGPIKTSTALGGAVARVRDPMLLGRMRELQLRYLLQSRRAYLSRLVKYAMLKALSQRHAYRALVWSCGRLGVDHDRAFGNATHAFGSADFFTQIRHCPCAPLLRMLKRRLANFPTTGVRRLNRRTLRGNQLVRALPAGIVVGERNASHTYWIMPVRVANTAEVIAALQAAGFDGTSRSSLIVEPSSGGSYVEKSQADWLAETVFIPNGHAIGDAAWGRLIEVLRSVAVATSHRKRGNTRDGSDRFFSHHDDTTSTTNRVVLDGIYRMDGFGSH